jgi:hypothetical protein
VLGQQIGVLGGDHLVVVAIGDQNGLLDGGQTLQASVVTDTPGGDRDELGVADGKRGRGVPLGGALAEALEELDALGLAGGALLEEQGEQALGGGGSRKAVSRMGPAVYR